VPGYTPPRLSQRVMLHGHCHHKAIATLEHEEALADPARCGSSVRNR
jgi:UDP-2,3-diacylglucosamine pyrophosphatase LpxH